MTTSVDRTLFASDSPDAFTQVLADLQGALTDVKAIEPVLGDILSLLETVQDIFSLFDDLMQLLPIASVIIDAVSGLSDALDGVPGVDVVVAPVSVAMDLADTAVNALQSALGPVQKDIVDPLEPILSDIIKGLTDIQEVVSWAVDQLPDALNTLQILDYLADIAAPIVQVLQGSTASDQLNTLLTGLLKVKDGVEAASGPLSTLLGLANTAIGVLTTVLDDANQALGGTVQAAVNGASDVHTVLGPISDAFDEVKRKVAPIRWALDASSWVFKHVAEPVIDKVLSETGLSGLVDGLQTRVLGDLGFSALAGLVQTNSGNSQAQGQQSASGSGAGTNAQSLWTTMTTALGQYQTNRSEALRTAMTGLVSAIAGTAIDPNKPAVIPPWPLPPPLSTGSAPSVAQIRRPVIRRMLLAKTIAHVTPLRLRPGALVTAPSGDSWPGIAALGVAITDAEHQLGDAETNAASLAAQLTAYQAARSLPAGFAQQMTDLQQIFGTVGDLFGFVASYTAWSPYLSPVQASMSDQVTLAGTLATQATASVSAGQAIDDTVTPILAAVPANQQFATLFASFDGWRDGAALLSQVVDQGEAVDTQLGGTYATQLQSLHDQIDGAAQALATRIATMATTGCAISSGAANIASQLTTLGTCYQQLAGHSQVVGQSALPQLHQAAHLLGVIDSIFDPLSCLLQMEGCVDNGNAMKLGANSAVQLIQSQATQSLAGFGEKLQSGLDQLIDAALPLGAMSTDVTTVNAQLGQCQTSLGSLGPTLVQNLGTLTQQMAPGQSYVVTINGKSVDLSNDFVDSALATSAGQLFAAITAAAQAKGITLPVTQ